MAYHKQHTPQPTEDESDEDMKQAA